MGMGWEKIVLVKWTKHFSPPFSPSVCLLDPLFGTLGTISEGLKFSPWIQTGPSFYRVNKANRLPSSASATKGPNVTEYAKYCTLR